MQLLGVDGCRAGWVAAFSDESLERVDFRVFLTIGDILAYVEASGEFRLVIDISIGLPGDGPRACDIQARKLLGPGGTSRVFPAPLRSTLACTDYREACSTNAAGGSGGISRQLFAILAKIREVDNSMTTQLQSKLREGHPEVTFFALSPALGGIQEKKRTAADEQERLELMMSYGVTLDVSSIRSRLGASLVARDDIVDAAACLISAYRFYRHIHLTLSNGTVQMDQKGLRMEMIA